MTWVRRRLHLASMLFLAIVTGTLAVNAAPLTAQVPDAPRGAERSRVAERPPAAEADQPSALAEIDRLAARSAAFVRRHVPDRAGATVWILPFSTDTGVATRLGHRLQSAVHLRLLRDYRSAEIRVVARRPIPASADAAPADVAPRLPAGAASARHALELEIQPFRETLRVVLRVLSSGAVRAGDWIDVPANEELQELLDGAAAGADAGRWQRASGPEQRRTPLASTISVDRGQQRYTTAGEDWVELQVPSPGFYLLEGRSFSGPVTLSLHYGRTGPPVVTALEDVPSVAGGDPDGLPRGVDRVLGLFSGPMRSYARISSTSEQHVAFYLRLRPLSPPRRFADATTLAVPLERGTGFQTLRVFRTGSYRVVVEAGGDDVALRVFSVPQMRSVAPVSAARPVQPGAAEAATLRYELAAGDYLIEVTSAPATPAARVCWAASDSNGGNRGCAG